MIKSICLLPLLLLYMTTLVYATAPCKLRVYLARAEQTDEHGRKCWDTVKVPACGGRCDSREVSEPYTNNFIIINFTYNWAMW